MSRHNPPEVSDLITEALLAGRLSQEDLEELAGPENSTDEKDDDLIKYWTEDGVEYREFLDTQEVQIQHYNKKRKVWVYGDHRWYE